MNNNWILVSEQKPEIGIEVLGFSKEWIDEDFNPTGQRVCFLNESKDGYWLSAEWLDYQDTYVTDDKTAPTHWMPRPQSPTTV
jgi:hypothetical protein